MDEIEGDLLTLEEADFVDITDEALDASGGETINLVPSLKSDSVLPDVYTIGADGKLVSVSHINDFKKHHDTSPSTTENTEDIAGTYIIGDNGEVVHVSNLADFEKHHKQGVEHFRKEAFKRGSAHLSSPGESFTPSKITIRNVSAADNGGTVQAGSGNVHIFSVPYVTKPPKLKPKPQDVLPKILPVQYGNATSQQRVQYANTASQRVEGGSLQTLPVSSPITYINGVPGQIVSGRQLQELQTILGYQPKIVSDAAIITTKVKPVTPVAAPPAPSSAPSAPKIHTRHAIILPASVTPMLQKPLTNPPGGKAYSSISVGRKCGTAQQDVSQTIIAKNSATYQREKNYYFSQTSVLSPLIPPHLTKKLTDEAANEALHLNSKVSLMTEISDDWNMQGCITFGTGTEGQVFAPRLLVPRNDGSVASHAHVDGTTKKYPSDVTASEELMQYQGMYSVIGMDLHEDLFVKTETPPSDTIGVEHVYSSFEAVSGVRQHGAGRPDTYQENDLIEEDVEEEKSDFEVEFDMGENSAGEKITLNLKRMAELSDNENVEVWTIKREEDDSFVAAAEASTSNHDGAKTGPGALASKSRVAVDPFEKYSGFACYLCLYASKDREHILQHWLDCHKSSKPYLCPYCKQEFGVSCNIFNHILLHHTEEKKKSFLLTWSPIFKQNIEVTLNEDGIASHVQIHDEPGHSDPPWGEFLFSCLGCRYRTTSITGIRRHLREMHYKVLPYLCPYCGAKFSSCFEAKQHVCMHHEQWPIKVFVSKRSLKNIDDSVIIQRFDIIPLESVEMSAEEDLLGTQLWNVSREPDGERYCCGRCSFEANCRSVMYSHVTTEHRLRGIVCPKCKFYNSLKQACWQRGWSTCEKCLYFFNLNLNSTTKGEKVVSFFMCLECKHLDRGRGSMLQHLRYMHVKCRPFSCAYCSYSHVEKTKVRVHILLKHKNKPLHILKNRDLDNRAMDAMSGMYKKVPIPQSLVAKLEKMRPSFKWGSNDGNLVAAPASRIKRSDIISLSAFRKRQTNEQEETVKDKDKDPSTRRYMCKLCDHASRDRYAMNRHVKSYHLNGKPYTCACCRYGASFRYLVERHMRLCHPTAPAYVNTNYKMLELLDEACKQYYRPIGKLIQNSSATATPVRVEGAGVGNLPPSIGSIQIHDTDIDPEEEEDLEEMMVQEEEESDEEKPQLGSSADRMSSMTVPYLPIGDLKQRILDLHPEFQLDQNLVNEPVVILEDIMSDILKSEKKW